MLSGTGKIDSDVLFFAQQDIFKWKIPESGIKINKLNQKLKTVDVEYRIWL